MMNEIEIMWNGYDWNRWRCSNYLSFILKFGVVLINNILFIQPNVVRLDDVRALDDFNVKMKILNWLNYVLNINYRFDNLKQYNLKDYDFQIRNILEINF